MRACRLVRMPKRPVRWLPLLLVLVLTSVTALPALGQAGARRPEPQIVEGDMLVDPVSGTGRGGSGLLDWAPVSQPFAADPFIAWREVTTITGGHTWEVWRCDAPWADGDLSVATASGYLNTQASSYFETLSRGRYDPVFSSGGSYSVDLQTTHISACLFDTGAPYDDRAAPGGHGFLALSEGHDPGGIGGPGVFTVSGGQWDLEPGTRQGAVGEVLANYNASQFGAFVTPVVLHEIGHGLGWPHVPIRGATSPYTNPLDIMSAPSGPPYVGTAMVNLYASGWVDPSEVTTWNGGFTRIRLGTLPTSRTKMVVIPTGDSRVFYTVSVQPQTFDSTTPIGVVVHLVDQRFTGQQGYCPGANTCTLLTRKVELIPPTGWNGSGLPMVTPGKTVDESYWQVSISGNHSDGYTVAIGGFTDTIGHLFRSEINGIAAAGITRGCNPPTNSRFCPVDAVTRGEMAAFLFRALDLPAGSKVFSDTAGHLFQDEVAALEAAGITRGCNPPSNTRFCPDRAVTRGEMAAFLVRALDLAPGSKVFSDTAGHVFQAEIAALEAAGITRGCNPPSNTRFCPDEPVTRGQMAAFLVRAGLAD